MVSQELFRSFKVRVNFPKPFHACMQVLLVSSLLLVSHAMLSKLHTKRQITLKNHFSLLPLACTVNACGALFAVNV